MGDKSAIEWTEATWTAIRARHRVTGKVGWICTRVSQGCVNCYSAAMNGWRGNGEDFTVPGLGQVEPFLDEEVLTQPLRWRATRRIFVCSMTDLFGEWVPDEWIDRIFAVMALAPRHTFQVLTKRPERMLAYLTAADRFDSIDHGGAEDLGVCHVNLEGRWPLPNVWLGVSVEDQATADERIPLLLQTPAEVRWVSYEPALGPVTFDKQPGEFLRCPDCGYTLRDVGEQMDHSLCKGPGPGLHWIVVGGESGPGARPFDLAWARQTIAQCRATGVPVFVKQLGAMPSSWEDGISCAGVHGETDSLTGRRRLRDRKGGDMSEWPDDLRVREWPRGRG